MSAYIGFRVELASRSINGDPAAAAEMYNAAHESQIFDMYINGKIALEKREDMLIARGEKGPRKSKKQLYSSAQINFALVVPIEPVDLERVVRIVNVLGNGRLIKERVKVFTDGTSAINNLPEMSPMIAAFVNLEAYMPGIITSGWYYAPEAIFA